MTSAETDPTMTAINDAVMRGHRGETDEARRALTSIWESVGPAGDPFHRCTVGHYLADLQSHPAESLVWNVRALDAADTVTDDRVDAHAPGVRVAAFYPSLHLNLADDFRRLGCFDTARDHLTAAAAATHTLGDDGYGTMIRNAIDEVRAAVDAGDQSPRSSAPGTA